MDIKHVKTSVITSNRVNEVEVVTHALANMKIQPTYYNSGVFGRQCRYVCLTINQISRGCSKNVFEALETDFQKLDECLCE